MNRYRFFFSLLLLCFLHTISWAQPGAEPEPGIQFTLALQAGGRTLTEAELKKVSVSFGEPELYVGSEIKKGLLIFGLSSGTNIRYGDVAKDTGHRPSVIYLKFGNLQTKVDFQKGVAESLTYIVDLDKKEQVLDVAQFKNTYRFSKIDNGWIHDTTGLDFTVWLRNEGGKLTSVRKHWTTFTHHDRPDSYSMQFWVEGFVRTTRSQTYDGFEGPVLDFVLTDGSSSRHMELGQVWGRTAGPRTMHESLNFESWGFSIVPTQSELKREVTPPFSFHDISRADLELPILKVHLYPKYTLREGETLDITLYEYFMTCEDSNLKGYWRITNEGDKKYLDLMLERECDRNTFLNLSMMSALPYTFQLTLPKGTYDLRYRNANLPESYPAFLTLKANSLYPVRVEVY